MRKILTIVALSAVMFSCGSKPEKTIENLKSAITGETNASNKYAIYAQKAEADSMFNVAAMLRATSKAEAIHAANHTAVLVELGVTDFVPVVDEVVVATTLENLADAKKGEDYEVATMYPEFVKVAQEEGSLEAETSFSWANSAEVKHSAFYAEAIDVISATGTDAGFTAVFVVCPKCGDTYKLGETGTACALCATPSSDFISFAL